MSAAGNLLAVAIFSRMAGPAEYGHYVLIFAWSLIVYGFGAQWMRFAYFGVYHLERFGEYVALAGAAARLPASTLVALVLTALGLFGFFEPSFSARGICAGLRHDHLRSRLRSGAHAAQCPRRGAVDDLARRAHRGVRQLPAFSSAAARAASPSPSRSRICIAAAPSLATFARFRLSHFSRAASLHIISYGWPLLLSFGVTAVGQSIDRLLLAHYLGLATLGPYGVVADMLRQSFTVLGEAIILSLVTVAKTQSNRGQWRSRQQDAADGVQCLSRRRDFRRGVLHRLRHVVLRAVLQPEFVAPTRDLIPIFAIAFAFIHHAQLLFRAGDLFHQCELSRPRGLGVVPGRFRRRFRCCWFRPTARMARPSR